MVCCEPCAAAYDVINTRLEEDSDLVCQAGTRWEDINQTLKEKGIPLFFPVSYRSGPVDFLNLSIQLDPGPGAVRTCDFLEHAVHILFHRLSEEWWGRDVAAVRPHVRSHSTR